MVGSSDMWEAGLYSAIAPWVLLLIASVWSYPAALEELVKWAILKSAAKRQRLTTQHGVLVGLVFGLSESIFYTLNAWGTGQWGAIGMRLLLTVPMHLVTAGAIAVSMRRGWGIAGVLIAVVIHMSFNTAVGH